MSGIFYIPDIFYMGGIMEYFTGEGRCYFLKEMTSLFTEEFKQSYLYFKWFFDKFWLKSIDKENFWIDLFSTIVHMDLPVEGKSFDDISNFIEKIFTLSDKYLKLELSSEERAQAKQFISFLIIYYNSEYIPIKTSAEKIRADKIENKPFIIFLGVWAYELLSNYKITDGWERKLIQENEEKLNEILLRYNLRREAYFEDYLEYQSKN